MVICKENQLYTMVSINRYKRNHLMTHCFGGLIGLDCLERIAAKLREEFLFEVILGIHFPSANWRAGSYQIKASREDWHHDKSLQQVSWFCLWAMAVLVLIFHVEWNDPPRKDLPFDVCHRCTTLEWIWPSTWRWFSKNLCVSGNI